MEGLPAARVWVHRHSPWRSVALYAAAVVPLSAALAHWSWYSFTLALSLLLAGYTLADRTRRAGFILLWCALVMLLAQLFWNLGPAPQVLASVIVLLIAGSGLLAWAGRLRRG